MTALQAKSCSSRPWVHGVTALFRSRIMQILIPFRSHLRLAGHEIRKMFPANKSFCHQEREGEGDIKEGMERRRSRERGSCLLADGLSEQMREEREMRCVVQETERMWEKNIGVFVLSVPRSTEHTLTGACPFLLH